VTRASGALRAHSVLSVSLARGKPLNSQFAGLTIHLGGYCRPLSLPAGAISSLLFIAEDRPIWPPDALIASSGHSRTMRLWRAAQQYSLVDVGLPGAGVDVTQLRSLFLRISCDVIVGLRWIQPEQASGSAPALSVGNRRCRQNRHHGDRTENECKKAGAFHLVEFQHGDVSLSRLMRRSKGQGDRSA
jgi:hypothetical protein